MEGFLFEHMKAVAKRRAGMLTGSNEREWKKDLVENFYWSEDEAEKMLAIAKKEREKNEALA